MPAKNIGVLGSGVVARTLAGGFLKHGYSVMVGTREPAKFAEWQAKSAPPAKISSFADSGSGAHNCATVYSLGHPWLHPE